MPIDDRKRRILMAIVTLYSSEGEPVGSNLLSRYFDMAVSSATLRNEMAALTKLGLLEQPHTSAGRVPTAKGYRYYVDNLLDSETSLEPAYKEHITNIVRNLDYDPEKLAQGAAKALSDLLGYAVIATTPLAKDTVVAHYEVLQVGRYTAAVLAVTAAGGVLTRVAKVDCELRSADSTQLAQALNQYLRFVAEADLDSSRIREMIASLGDKGAGYWPVFSAALTLLKQAGKPSIYFEGQQHLLKWPELKPGLATLLELAGDRERTEHLLRGPGGHTVVLFGDELPEKPIPGLCLVSRQYLAGGGLSGAIAVAGPARMRFADVIPTVEFFSDLMGKTINSANPGDGPPRR